MNECEGKRKDIIVGVAKENENFLLTQNELK